MLASRALNCFRILARESDKLALIANAVGYTRAWRLSSFGCVGACAPRRRSGDAPIYIRKVTLTRETHRHRNITDRSQTLRQHHLSALDSFARDELMRRQSGRVLEAAQRAKWNGLMFTSDASRSIVSSSDKPAAM
jgi:hypothetical protein